MSWYSFLIFIILVISYLMFLQARMLLEAGAFVEEPNDESYTPLMEASREGHAVSTSSSFAFESIVIQYFRGS